MTKTSDSFRTPPTLFKELDSVFNFWWDLTCDRDNCLVEAQKTIWIYPYDYLKLDIVELHKKIQLNFVSNRCIGALGDSLYMNPPYSNPLPFIKKAWDDSKYFRVVMLLKADMSTQWFNYALDSEPDIYTIHMNQRTGESLTDVIIRLNNRTQKVDYKNIGIIHLRNRVKFYVSEEVFEADKNAKLKNGKIYEDIYTYKPKYGSLRYDTIIPTYEEEIDQLIETKNYRRVEDGIVSKAGANFASMLVVFDRREVK